MEALQQTWTKLYREELPSLAREKNAAQEKWPVRLDHCFARIILDNAVGKDKPWMEVVKAPATKNMTESQIRAAIVLGEDICKGKANLVELDNRSLNLRGKTKTGGGKRKREGSANDLSAAADGKPPEDFKRSKRSKSTDIRDAFHRVNVNNENTGRRDRLNKTSTGSVGKPSSAEHVKIETKDKLPLAQEKLFRRILSAKSLPPFRRNVLLLLAQVPVGRITTYGAIAKAYKQAFGEETNARAVGSAMRNNPFAPDVPCHRVIASDGRIGGFGGEWGEGKSLPKEKRRILREEGVRFGGDGKVAGQVFTAFHRLDHS